MEADGFHPAFLADLISEEALRVPFAPDLSSCHPNLVMPFWPDFEQRIPLEVDLIQEGLGLNLLESGASQKIPSPTSIGQESDKTFIQDKLHLLFFLKHLAAHKQMGHLMRYLYQCTNQMTLRCVQELDKAISSHQTTT